MRACIWCCEGRGIVARMSAAISGIDAGSGPGCRCAHPGYGLNRHCEERSDEVIHATACGSMDCFASLAMTAERAPSLSVPWIRDHAAGHQPVPDEQHHQRADGGGDEAGAL